MTGSPTQANRQPTIALCGLDKVGTARWHGYEPALCPAVSLVPQVGAAVFASLPIVDANGRLLEALMSLETMDLADRPRTAAFFAADPLLHPAQLFMLLRRAGIERVVNYPSVGLFDGAFAENLEQVGCGTTLELERLVAAEKAGFAVCALVRGYEALASVVDARLQAYAWLPGYEDRRPAPPQDAEWLGTGTDERARSLADMRAERVIILGEAE